MTKKSISNRPVAKCSICGHTSKDADLIGKPCELKSVNRKCEGVYSTILYPENWHECDVCGANGRIDDIRCETCDGSGWIYIS